MVIACLYLDAQLLYAIALPFNISHKNQADNIANFLQMLYVTWRKAQKPGTEEG